MSAVRAEVPQEKPGFVLAGGVRLRIARWDSEGGDYPALLVHGLSSGWQTWLPPLPYLYPALAPVALDLRGHGDSDKPESEYSLAHYAADVWTAMTKLRFKRPPVLIGHSLGGAVVRRVAADHAEFLAAVVIEDSYLWTHRDRTAEQAEQMGRDRLASARLPFPDLVQAELDRDPSLSYRQATEKARRVANVADGVLLNMWEGVALPDGERWEDVLPRITCPALLVRGNPNLGGLVPEEDAARQAALFPRLAVASFPEAGHSIHGDQPEAFAAAVLGFLRENGVLSEG